MCSSRNCHSWAWHQGCILVLQIATRAGQPTEEGVCQIVSTCTDCRGEYGYKRTRFARGHGSTELQNQLAPSKEIQLDTRDHRKRAMHCDLKCPCIRFHIWCSTLYSGTMYWMSDLTCKASSTGCLGSTMIYRQLCTVVDRAVPRVACQLLLDFGYYWDSPLYLFMCRCGGCARWCVGSVWGMGSLTLEIVDSAMVSYLLVWTLFLHGPGMESHLKRFILVRFRVALKRA